MITYLRMGFNAKNCIEELYNYCFVVAYRVNPFRERLDLSKMLREGYMDTEIRVKREDAEPRTPTLTAKYPLDSE